MDFVMAIKKIKPSKSPSMKTVAKRTVKIGKKTK